MMKKTIALVGLNNFNNIGDRMISETMRYLIEKNREHKVETYFVDINPYDSYCKVHLPVRFKCFNLIRKLEYAATDVLNSEKLLYGIQYFSWKVKLYKHFKQQLEKADAIIFTGGAFIKFRTQELNYLVELVIQIAMDKGIPVMMSGMGVEGYSPTDPRCQKLKQAMNRPCVKMITTRDDLALLNEKYIENKSIKTALVGDPAFYIPEYYRAERKASGVVGVGIIRKDIFLKYGIRFTEEQVMALYQEIIEELEARGIAWKLFSNGFTSDYQFGLQLLERMGIDKSKYTPRPEDTSEFVHMIAEFDAIIAARLHAVITAYSLDIPAIGLIWNEKIELFGALIGKPDNFMDVNAVNARHIVDMLEEKRHDRYDAAQRNELKQLTNQYIGEFIDMLQ